MVCSDVSPEQPQASGSIVARIVRLHVRAQPGFEGIDRGGIAGALGDLLELLRQGNVIPDIRVPVQSKKGVHRKIGGAFITVEKRLRLGNADAKQRGLPY